MADRPEASGGGSDTRPALVMLHGFALDARMWRPQVRAFASEYRMLLVDLPGFGPQARAARNVEPARELGRAMAVARLDRAHLVASCFGAAVAIDFALQHPERVASLTLAAPMLVGRPLGVESWELCASLAAEGDTLSAAETWLDDPLFEPLRRDEELFEEVREIVLDYGGGHWTGKARPVWSEPDPLSRLHELTMPAMVLSGEQDTPSFMLTAEAYAKALPNARREIVRGVGHYVNLEAPEAFDEALARFLGSRVLR